MFVILRLVFETVFVFLLNTIIKSWFFLFEGNVSAGGSCKDEFGRVKEQYLSAFLTFTLSHNFDAKKKKSLFFDKKIKNRLLWQGNWVNNSGTQLKLCIYIRTSIVPLGFLHQSYFEQYSCCPFHYFLFNLHFRNIKYLCLRVSAFDPIPLSWKTPSTKQISLSPIKQSFIGVKYAMFILSVTN